MLADRAGTLVKEIFPAGVKEGSEFRIGSLAGEKGRSMSVRLSGAKAGVWSDFSSGEAGDALDLVSMALFKGDKGQAIQWAKVWLGIDEDAGNLKPTRPAIPEKRTMEEPDNRAHAFRLWLGAHESLLGTAAETYLLGRGINLRQLPCQPRALRFHSGLKNRESGQRWPALLAAIHGRGGKINAVHRTWLDARPDGLVVKAPLKDAKMTLGSYRGGAIRISRGATGKPLGGAEPGETVIITEGIEDALTIVMARPDYRMLCAVSLANMGSRELPPAIATVIIAADNDGDNPAAAKALKRAIGNFQGQGRTVKIARPPIGYKDFNEILQKGTA